MQQNNLIDLQASERIEKNRLKWAVFLCPRNLDQLVTFCLSLKLEIKRAANQTAIRAKIKSFELAPKYRQ
jgi:hypothetical protein